MRTETLYKWQIAFETYLFTCKRRPTAMNQLRALQRVMAAMPWARHPGDITRPDVLDYKKARQKAGVPAYRIDAELSSLRQFYNWMRDQEIVFHNPVEKIPKLAPWDRRKE